MACSPVLVATAFEGGGREWKVVNRCPNSGDIYPNSANSGERWPIYGQARFGFPATFAVVRVEAIGGEVGILSGALYPYYSSSKWLNEPHCSAPPGCPVRYSRRPGGGVRGSDTGCRRSG